MEQLILPLLFVAVLASLASVAMQFMAWFMHINLANRVAKLEAQQANTLTHGETIRIYERLSSLEALCEAQAATLDSIKEHLLEND